MKVIQSVLVAISLLAPALPSFSAQAALDQQALSASQSDLIDAAAALTGNSRTALVTAQEIAQKVSSADLSTAIRLTRLVNYEAYNILLLLEDGASDDEVLDRVNALQNTIYQLDATKRKLQSKYPELKNDLNSVRTSYYYLQILLTDG